MITLQARRERLPTLSHQALLEEANHLLDELERLQGAAAARRRPPATT